MAHPDILEFIECKHREEKKVRVLVEEGYDAAEANDSVLFQNANLSVRLSDEFMQAVQRDDTWTTHWVTDPAQPGPRCRAREMLHKMADCAWHCGDPGVQYDSTINRWHTCPNSGPINASNPCSEYMFLDDSACNLASVNLMKFRREDGTLRFHPIKKRMHPRRESVTTDQAVFFLRGITFSAGNTFFHFIQKYLTIVYSLLCSSIYHTEEVD